jgi:hypothetical protein
MSKIKITDLIDLLKPFENKQLKDKDLDVSFFPEAQVEETFPVLTDDITFSVGANADFLVALFNDQNDKDDEEIIGNDDKAVIKFTPDKAWIKYSTIAGAKATANVNWESIGFSFDADQGIIMNSYKVHAPEEKVLEAVVHDVTDFPAIVSKKSILNNLQVGDAVSMHIRGKLQAGITLKWADIFSTGLQVVSKFLDINETLSIKAEAAASIGFKISMEDDFAVVVAKKSDDRYHLKVNKSVSTSTGINAGISAGIELEQPDALKDILNKVFESLVDMGEDELQKIIEKINSGDPLESKVLEKIKDLADRLGVDINNGFDELLDKIIPLKEKVKESIEKIAISKVKAGFEFEYNRINTDRSIFEAVVSKSVLNTHHNELVKFNIKPILSSLQTHPAGIELINYLNEKSIERNISWGFTISLGNKLKLSGKDRIETDEDSTTKIFPGGNKKEKYSLVGTRLYKGIFGKDEWRWGAVMKAQMNNYSELTTPRLSEFEYGLQVIIEEIQKKTMPAELRSVIDQAVLWEAVNIGEKDKLEEELVKELKGIKDIQYTNQIYVENEAFTELISDFAGQGVELMANAFGASMPYVDFLDHRKFLVARQQLYAPLWMQFLEDPDKFTPHIMARLASKSLKSVDNRLAKWENPSDGKLDDKSIGGILQLNPSTFSQMQSLLRGAFELEQGLVLNKTNNGLLLKSFKRMQQFWTQSFHIRILGKYLLDIAKSNGISEGIESSLTIKYTKDGKEFVRILGQS